MNEEYDLHKKNEGKKEKKNTNLIFILISKSNIINNENKKKYECIIH